MDELHCNRLTCRRVLSDKVLSCICFRDVKVSSAEVRLAGDRHDLLSYGLGLSPAPRLLLHAECYSTDIFCLDCANEIFSGPSMICTACETTLDQPDDVVVSRQACIHSLYPGIIDVLYLHTPRYVRYALPMITKL